MKKLFMLLLLCTTLRAEVLPELIAAAPGYRADFPALIRGTVVDRKDYPAVVWIGNCTATVAGPRTIVTAAHCTTSGRASTTIGTDRFSLTCVSSPNYPRNSTHDFSVCFSDRDMTGFKYEVVNLEPDHVKTGDWILQSGFGCTVWGGRLDGQLRVGRSQILSSPSGSSADYTTGNGAVLCSGDSGGPAWSLNADGSRNRLISTNSRSNTRTRSYLSAWATQEGIRFLRAAVASRNTQACGITDGAQNCRNGRTEPTVFTVASPAWQFKMTVPVAAKYSAEDAQVAMQTALNALGE